MLVVDGSRTHITLSTITECKELGEENVVLPAHLTDVIQLLDRSVFKAQKEAFTRLERGQQTGRKDKAARPASFFRVVNKSLCGSTDGPDYTKWFQILWHQPF